MSLETLLEAAEFLEWNKHGKKTVSRATRTSKKAEKFKPNVLPERKRKAQVSKVSHAKVANMAKESASVEALLSEEAQIVTQYAGVTDEQLIKDEEGEQKLSLREIRKSIGNRETHNKLEKNRRAHLKECFEDLRKELPLGDDRRSSNLGTLRSALRLIERLASQQKDLESEKRRLQRLKNSTQAHVNTLRKELQDRGVVYNIEDWIEAHNTSTNSTSTAPECSEAMMDTVNTEGVGELNAGLEGSSSTVVPTDAQLSVINTGSKTQLVLNTIAAATENDTKNAPNPALQFTSVQVVPATSAESRSAVSAITMSQAAPAPQAVTVTKINHGPGGPGTGVPTKIVLTPKVLSNPADVGVVHPSQLCSMAPAGQLFISPSNASGSTNFFISPAQPAGALTVVPGASSVGSSGPFTLNLQAPSGTAAKLLNPVQTAAVSSSEQANLSIAPKQLVLITPAGAGTPTIHQQQHRIRSFTAAPSATSSAITLSPSPVTQQSTPSIIPLSSFANIQSLQQPAAVKPAVITGMLPSTAADGTISYFPVQLTTRPAQAAMTAVPSRSTTTMSLPFLGNGAGGGLTFVIPSANTSTSTGNVQLVAVPQSATIQLASSSSATPATTSTHSVSRS